MTLLQTLAAGPRRYSGRGVNHEGEDFTGTLAVEPLVGGRGVLLHYTARLDEGSEAHAESTLLAPGPDGRLVLWPVMSELDAVLPHTAVRAAGAGLVFATGPRDDESAFREEITIAPGPGGELTLAHAWGLPGGPFADRSSCRLLPVPEPALRLGTARVFVRDLAEAQRFYGGLLALPLRAGGAASGFLVFEAGPVQLVVEPVGADAPADEQALVGRFTGLSFTVASVQAQYQALRERGVAFVEAPERQPWGGVLATFADPAGNRLQLVEPPAAP